MTTTAPLINPFLIVLAESEAADEPASTGLLKMMAALAGDRADPLIPVAAAEWHGAYGEPTFESMRRWAVDYAADPENTQHMIALRRRHAELSADLTAEEREYLAPFIAAGYQ